MIKFSENVLMQILDSGSDGLIVVRADKSEWPILYVNAVIEAMTGFDASELIDRPLADFIGDGDKPAFPWDGSTSLTQTWQCHGGGRVQAEFRVSPLYEGPGKPAYLLLSADGAQPAGKGAQGEDSMRIALKDAHVRLRRLEQHDGVTGLINRKTFAEFLQRDWGMARREQRPLALIIFEIDAFDNYRELFGRHAADSALRKVAHAINGALRRAGDIVARYESRRFAALIGSADLRSARELADRVAARVRNLSIHHPRSDVDRFLTVSCGVASETPDRKSEKATLIDQAEEDLAVSRRTAAPRQQAG